jgi:hypothetical protein
VPTLIDLSTLAPGQGFIIQGDAEDDRAGYSVSDAGDVNGDGFDDIIVGARNGDDGGENAGEAYVIFGHAGGFGTIDLSSLGSAGFIIRGADPYDRTGTSVSSAGDVNGDGFDDLIVGAPQINNVGADGGDAYVIFGRATGQAGTVIDLANFATAGFVIQGDTPNDRAGFSVSSAGDVNGDGWDDLIVGAIYGDDGGTSAGEAYVVFGGVTRLPGTVIDLTNLGNNGFVLVGEEANDRAGVSVSSAGDVNGDGFDDIIVGAPYNDAGGSQAGRAYVVFGSASGLAGTTTDLGALGSAGFVIEEAGASGRVGASVSGAGDINGDGFADIIVGTNREEAFVIFGRADGLDGATIDLANLGSAGIVIRGQFADVAEFDGFGTEVSSAGDVNGDGFDDLIFGAPYASADGLFAGQAFVVFGRGGWAEAEVVDVSNLLPSRGFVIQGDTAYDNAGGSVSGAGDINGDGFADIIVGAADGDDGGDSAGEGYVIFGQAPTEAVTRYGTDIAQTIAGGAFNDTLLGLGGSDMLLGAGGDDTLLGGNGNDTIDGGAGADFMLGGGGNDTYVVDSQGDFVFEHAGDGTSDHIRTTLAEYELGANLERLTGLSSTRQRLVGNELSNTINGGTGNDIIDGRGGIDVMSGGLGNDRYNVDDSADLIVEGSSAGYDVVISSVSYTLWFNAERLLLTGTASIDGTGNALDNMISGNTGANLLIGDGGNDILNGGVGADDMRGGIGDDTYWIDDAGDVIVELASQGIDRVTARIDYTLTANVETLALAGTGRVGTGNGLDNLLQGSNGHDTLSGLGGADTLRGNDGNDTLLGGAGTDAIHGGAGRDILTGGSERDVFFFAEGDGAATRGGADTITDFSQADAEKIRLDQIDANVNAGGNQAFAWIGNAAFSGVAGQLHYVHAGGNTYVEGDTNGDGTADFVLNLTGTINLVAADFVL